MAENKLLLKSDIEYSLNTSFKWISPKCCDGNVIYYAFKNEEKIRTAVQH